MKFQTQVLNYELEFSTYNILVCILKHVILTKKISDGVGVNLFILIWDNMAGKCPYLAPTKHILEDVIMWTLKPPKADTATKIDITHEK